MDHVINRDFTMEEAGRSVKPNINRSTVTSIVQTSIGKTGKYVFFVLFYSKAFL